MKELGLQAYRFSTAWGRVLPEGVGRINEKGLDFYERLVDALLANGIEPLLTLYHWDLPAALDDRGGWLNRDSADWFAEYASLMFGRFDGRVRKWVTLNEPWVITDGGYLHGALAPGHRNMFEAPIASHNLMRSHGAAVKAYRAIGAHEIGLVVNIEPKYPASAVDRGSCRHQPRRRLYEPPVSRSGASRLLSRRAGGGVRRGLAGVAGGGFRSDPPADRFRRHQLLHAQRREA